MSMGGSQKESTNTTPWDQQIPYLLKGFQQADSLYGGTPATTPKAPVAPTPQAGGAYGANGQYDPTKDPYGFEWAKNRGQPQGTPAISGYSQMVNGEMQKVARPYGAEPVEGGAGYGGIVGQYYPGQTVAGQSGFTRMAGAGYANTAGNPMDISGSTDQLNSTLSGSYMGMNPGDPTYSAFANGTDQYGQLTSQTASGSFLNSNPYLDTMVANANRSAIKNYTDMVKPNTDSAFALGGRYGSNSHYSAEDRDNENLTDSLSRTAGDIYGQNYSNERQLQEQAKARGATNMLAGAAGASGNFNDERNRQLSAAGLLPTVQATATDSNLKGLDALSKYGKQQDAYGQDLVNADISRWDYNQNLPYTALQRYMGLIQGNYGQQGSSKTKSSPGVMDFLSLL